MPDTPKTISTDPDLKGEVWALLAECELLPPDRTRETAGVEAAFRRGLAPERRQEDQPCLKP